LLGKLQLERFFMVLSTAKTQRSRYNPVFSLGQRMNALIRYNQLVFLRQGVLRKTSRCPHPIQCYCQGTPQFQLTQVALSSQVLLIPASVGRAATMLQ
jgi:hypothetical protein